MLLEVFGVGDKKLTGDIGQDIDKLLKLVEVATAKADIDRATGHNLDMIMRGIDDIFSFVSEMKSVYGE